MLLLLVFALALLADLTEGCAQEKVAAPVVLQAPSVNVQQTFALRTRYKIAWIP